MSVCAYIGWQKVAKDLETVQKFKGNIHTSSLQCLHNPLRILPVMFLCSMAVPMHQ